MTGKIAEFGAASDLPQWLRREHIAVVQFEDKDNIESAAAAIDTRSGRWLAFWGPNFPPEDPRAMVSEFMELAEILNPPPDIWFPHRVRGLVISTTHAILHGWQTPRDARSALAAILKTPETLQPSRPMYWFLELLALAGGGKTLIEVLTKAYADFADIGGRGRPPDETRLFFLEEITRIAIDNGMEPRLPQHRDLRNTGGTPFFTFVLAMVDVVVSRVYGTSTASPSESVRHRLVPFQCSRVAWLDALERARETVQQENEKSLKNQ